LHIGPGSIKKRQLNEETRQRIRRRLADEVGRIDKEAPFTVALLYPSPYAAAMSSLGYQRVYRALMESPGLGCERVVLDDEAETDVLAQGRPFSYESLRPLEAFPDDEWDFTFRTGLKASLWAMQAVFPYMQAMGGKIINFGSGNGIGAMKGTAAYNATKEAIRSLTRTAAAEWGRYGITVNVIVPTIVTDSAREFMAERPGSEAKLLSGIPLRRMGDVDRDIGPVAVFLASRDADFMTGQTIHVDGGQILRP